MDGWLGGGMDDCAMSRAAHCVDGLPSAVPGAVMTATPGDRTAPASRGIAFSTPNSTAAHSLHWAPLCLSPRQCGMLGIM